MKKVKVCVLRTAGTNCDKETAHAFLKAGARVELLHINKFIRQEKGLNDYHILALPGGFSYGDDVAAGKILANELKSRLKEPLMNFISGGKLIIGICNGFQILVKAGILPGNDGFKQEASLIINDSGKFEDRWVHLSKWQMANGKWQNKCVWVKGLPEVIYLPVAHGEGKFIVQDEAVLERLKKNNQIIFRYCREDGSFGGYPFNPNGSVDNIAGICDNTGRVLGLMPHPERHSFFCQHPRWTRLKKDGPEGLQIFHNGVIYARENLL